jgi:predicted ATPase
MKPVTDEDLLNMIRYVKTIRTEARDGGRQIEVVTHSPEIILPKPVAQIRSQI